MHRCLSVTDIVYVICEKLSEPLGLAGNFSRELASLAAFARTCRAVHEPALDHLWYTQTSIIPLLRCMPDGTWEYCPYHEEQNGYEEIERAIVGYPTNRILSFFSDSFPSTLSEPFFHLTGVAL